MRAQLTLLATLVVLLPASAGAVPTGSEFLVNTATLLDQRFPKVAVSGTGAFVAVWSSTDQDGSSTGVFAQRYDATGAPAGSEFRVNAYTLGAQSYPAVAADAAGRFVVVWQSNGQDGNDGGIFGRRYDGSGVSLGSEFQVNAYTTGLQGSPSVAAAAGGGFVVVWTSIGQDGSGSGVYAQRYDAAGVAQGSEFRVNTFTTLDQAAGGVGSDAAGDFVVVWTSLGQDGSSGGIFGQRYNASGVAQGSEFQVNSYTTSSQAYPRVASDSSGNFLVVWNSVGQDGSSGGIYAQRYNASGVAQGAEFRVNSYTTSIQVNPSVAADASGDFVVTWDSLDQDGAGAGIFAQRYTGAGAPIGTEFRVNTYTPGTQRAPAVAAGAAGSFVIAWESDGQDKNDFGVFGQRYAPEAPIAARLILLKDNADVRRRAAIFRGVDPAISARHDVGVDPTIDGAYIQVHNNAGGGDSECFFLPPSSWTEVGNPNAPVYRYKDPTSTNGPCLSALLSHQRVLKFVCNARTQPMSYSLDEPQQSSVGVRFTTGAATYCSVFGGEILRDSGVSGRFRARNALAPGVCPVPPVACP